MMENQPSPSVQPDHTNAYAAPQSTLDESAQAPSLPQWSGARNAWKLPVVGILVAIFINMLAKASGNNPGSGGAERALSILAGLISLGSILGGFVFTIIGITRLRTHAGIRGHVIGGGICSALLMLMLGSVFFAAGKISGAKFGPPTDQWVEVASHNKLFNVKMPGKPQSQQQHIPGEGGNVDVFIKVYEKPFMVYFVGMTEIHPAPGFLQSVTDGNEALKMLMQGVLDEQPGSKLVSHRAFEWHGQPALEATYRMNMPAVSKEPIHATNRWVWHRQVVLSVQFGCREQSFKAYKTDLTKAQTAYFNSFRLIGSTKTKR